MHRGKQNVIKKLILLCCFCVVSWVQANPVKVSIDANESFQKIRAFGASDAWIIDPLIKKWHKNGRHDKIEHLGKLLFDTEQGIGLTAWRFNIGAGSLEQGKHSQISLDAVKKPYRRAGLLQKLPYGPIDARAQQGQLDFLKLAAKYQVPDLIAFVNSPPVWATKNGLAYPNKTTTSSNLSPSMDKAFADFLVNTITYLRNDLAIPVNFISPVNEPTWDWKNGNQEGSPYNNQELKNIYLTLYQQLKASNLADKVQIEGGEVVEYSAALSDSAYKKYTGKNQAYQGGMNKNGNGVYKNYLEDFLGDQTMRQILGNKLSLHGYFSDASSNRLGKLRDQVWQHAQNVSPGAELWMSEMCILGAPADIRKFRGGRFDGQNMQVALHIARILHRDLTRLNVSAWHWWLAVTAYNYKDGLLKVNADLDADSLITSKTFWTLGHFSRFIRPGFNRIQAAGADNLNGLMVSAYQSANAKTQVIVIINAADTQKSLSLNGIKNTRNKQVSAYITHANANLKKFDIANTRLDQLKIPAESIVTLKLSSH